VLEVFVADQAGADAVTSTELTGTLSSTDAEAQAAGYRYKVVSGASVNYLKNVEAVSISIWNDANHNGQHEQNELSFVRDFPLASMQQPDPSTMLYMADIKGTPQDDNFGVDQLAPETKALMTTYQRGVHYDLGDGNDTVVGSAFGDGFVAGGGTNRIDGGDNTGMPPGGGSARDVLEVFVPDQAGADAVTVTELTGTLAGTDVDAQAAGYRYKAVSGASVNYLKNIESVSISIWNDANHDGMRGGDEVVFVRSVNLNPPPTMGGAPFEATLIGTAGNHGEGAWL
jgi:hypothetical protein